MFSGVYWNQPVSVHVSVCVQKNSLSQSAGRGTWSIKSNLVTALVSVSTNILC